jgi:Nucleotidyltransferase of unknown function (DUF6036)
MTSAEIEQYLREINTELALQNVKGEICLYGGAVMCLVYKARPATKDVDAIFEPVKFIRAAVRKITERHGLPVDWLNYAVKMFVVEHEKETFLDLSNLKVFVPAPEYLLAMKILAARIESFDVDDIKFLLDKLKLQTIEDALKIVENYYPRKTVKPETRFLLEELFETK